MEAIESGVFRADLPLKWKCSPAAYQGLIDRLDTDLGYAITNELKMKVGVDGHDGSWAGHSLGAASRQVSKGAHGDVGHVWRVMGLVASMMRTVSHCRDACHGGQHVCRWSAYITNEGLHKSWVYTSS